jgi:hypothetical protein
MRLRGTPSSAVVATTPTPTADATLSAPATAVPSSGSSTQPTPTTGTATQTATTTASSADLTTSFAALRPTLGVRSVGLVFAPVGAGTLTQLGDWKAGPAWSTMKVPLSLAALQQSATAGTTSLVHKAITESDNAAAESLWSQLGSGDPAAAAVDAVLASHGDTATRTQPQRIRPPYTPFGQTTWSLARQVTFASRMACSTADSPVYQEMSQVIASQRWGLGQLPGAAVKGGWGPDPSGRYLVRQFGVVRLDGHLVAVAVAVTPSSGSFDDGVHALDKVTDWLKQHVHPTTGGC